MENLNGSESKNMKAVEKNDLANIEGGLGLMGVDVSGMPSREVGGCGTMWLQDRLMKMLGMRM